MTRYCFGYGFPARPRMGFVCLSLRSPPTGTDGYPNGTSLGLLCDRFAGMSDCNPVALSFHDATCFCVADSSPPDVLLGFVLPGARGCHGLSLLNFTAQGVCRLGRHAHTELDDPAESC